MRVPKDLPVPAGQRLALPAVITLGTVFWQHLVLFGHGLAGHETAIVIDVFLLLPVAVLCTRLAERVRAAEAWEPVVRASATTLLMTAALVPLTAVQDQLHRFLGQQAHAAVAETAMAVFAVSLAGTVLAALRPPTRPQLRRGGLVTGRTAVTLATVLALLGVPGAPAQASGDVCAQAPQRTFNVYAIDVDITVDRFGDHDPYGYMYVLAEREQAVRDQEAALLAASAAPLNDPTAAKVSVGLGQDAIQPLVVRARLGECVVFNLTNKLRFAPRNGFGNPPFVQPGGVPPVSIDLAGVAYRAGAGEGGQPVGDNPTGSLAAPGETKQYKFFLDPLMGEGAKVFHSGGESTALTMHGLFGTLIAEPAGARWFDPRSGAERTNDSTWSNWEAMVSPPNRRSFREFTIIYHEIGDENFSMRRPLRENSTGIPFGGDTGLPVGDQVQFGRALPMIDGRPPTPTQPDEGGGGTNVYRPVTRAINYRSESFFRRLQLEAGRGSAAQQANKSLAYSSYTYGDPATPMPRSYLGEPTITRLVQAGVEQLHVHHLHGGGTRWLQNPTPADLDADAGLVKTPVADPHSIFLDSQTVSPMESYNLVHQCGAGGCQQAAGDFLYHCHIAQHYINGMWGLWRVFDTAQPDLARLPGMAPAPVGVTSAGLIGKTIGDKTVVPRSRLTDPAHQVAVEELVEGQLPPQGVAADADDATVWDWQKAGTDDAPVYLGEPETAAVWANYRSSRPGARPEMLFNPVTGRPAYPMLRPHLGHRPPFAPGHSGAPGLGETADARHPDGLCPRTAPVRKFDVTAIKTPIQATARERDDGGEIYVLNEDENAVRSGAKPADPLVIRSNLGDCVAITFGSELDPAAQPKVNMHTHLVQFDPLGSDGVVAGFAYEQAVFPATRENRTLTSVDAPDRITVSNVDRLRTGITIGVGVGTPAIEIRTIAAIDGTTVTFDAPLAKTHTAGEPVTVEFVRYRWYSDADIGTVFWHDHVNAIASWAHGLFAAHIVEPRGSTYRDPVTGHPVRSGTIVDVIAPPTTSVGVGQSGAFREFTLFLHNGRRGRTELGTPGIGGLAGFSFGQECEEGSINLRAAPLGERTPPGATPADPATTQQRQEFNGARCRNAFSQAPSDVAHPDANTVRATVTTVDPYAFSSVKYGEPMTPLLRAYAGDPVVVRTIGVNDRAEALRIQGHRFRIERFSSLGRLLDTATTGISERYDYVLDGGAGGPAHSPGDYLYYSTRTFALDSGAWGIFRVHDKRVPDLMPLPERTPPGGPGFPRQTAATGNTQASPGPDPAPAYRADGSVDTSVVTSTANPCPATARTIAYDVSLLDAALPTKPFTDTGGVIYALTADVAGIRDGSKPVQPLVLRANQGDCVSITLHNELSATSAYGGRRAGLDLGELVHNQQLGGGAAIGLNPDPTVGAGQALAYRFYADRELGTTVFTDLASPAAPRHGAYGLMIVEPRGSTWTDSETGVPLSASRTSTRAIISPPLRPRFREFALTMQTTDQHYSRSILPYGEQVAGNGLNTLTPFAFNIPAPPVPGAPPGTADHPGTYDKGFSGLNYTSEPLTTRLGLTANVNDYTQATVNGTYGTAYSSAVHGDPATPVLRAYARDPVVFRVGVGASDQLHSFTVGGHVFPLEPALPSSQLLTGRTVTAGETLDATVGPAGGWYGNTGDYLYGDARTPFAVAGLWGIFRVLPPGASSGPKPLS